MSETAVQIISQNAQEVHVNNGTSLVEIELKEKRSADDKQVVVGQTETTSVVSVGNAVPSSPKGTAEGNTANSEVATKTPEVPHHAVAERATEEAGEEGMQEIDIDELVPADSTWTTKRNGAVKLHMKTSRVLSMTPITIPTFIKSTVNKIPNSTAMAVKRNGQWVKWTYSQYLADIYRAGKAFIKLGLEPYKAVGIIGFNSPEWFISELGCIFAGGLATGIYTTNSPEACQYVASNSQCNIIVVENNQQLQKIVKVKDSLPHLKAIVQYTGEVAERADYIYSWADFMAKADEVPDSALEERMKALAPNKCALLIFTSGTTGNPKGVMLSHDNVTWTASSNKVSMMEHLGLPFGQMDVISYLPLSHIAAQMMDMWGPISYGGTVYFAQPDALKGTLSTTLSEVQPHVFFGVPRVWEKMQERMQMAARSVTGLKKAVGKWAKGVGLKANYAIMNGEAPPATYKIANKLLFKKVRGLLGLTRCRLLLSGAAPITRETLNYFYSIDLPICEVYGMSECSGPHSVGFPRMNQICSVGKESPGVSTSLVSADDEGNGEIVMFGRHVLMGYLDEEEKTKEVLDDNGGLHTGDIGKKSKDGFLYITGRIKELIITAGGENIPPVLIEDAVKEALPVVSQCMLIGDKRKFLSMLITLKTEVDLDSQEPTDTLTVPAVEWVTSVGSSSTTVTTILEPGDRNVLEAIQRGIDRVNSRATSNAQKIQKWSLLPKDFSIPGGELGPTMKMRRPIIHKMYSKTIGAFYDETSQAGSAAAP